MQIKFNYHALCPLLRSMRSFSNDIFTSPRKTLPNIPPGSCITDILKFKDLNKKRILINLNGFLFCFVLFCSLDYLNSKQLLFK